MLWSQLLYLLYIRIFNETHRLSDPWSRRVRTCVQTTETRKVGGVFCMQAAPAAGSSVRVRCSSGSAPDWRKSDLRKNIFHLFVIGINLPYPLLPRFHISIRAVCRWSVNPIIFHHEKHVSKCQATRLESAFNKAPFCPAEILSAACLAGSAVGGRTMFKLCPSRTLRHRALSWSSILTSHTLVFPAATSQHFLIAPEAYHCGQV